MKFKMCIRAALLALSALMLSAVPVLASPIPYVTTIFDTPNATVNQVVASLNTTVPVACLVFN